MECKYFIAFPVGGHECNELLGLMDAVAGLTRRPPVLLWIQF